MLKYFGQFRSSENGALRTITSYPGARIRSGFAALCVIVLMVPLLISTVCAVEVPLRMGFTAITQNVLPFWIAKEEKLFEKYNLRVELIYIQSAGIGVPALIGGDFQLLLGGVTNALQAASMGAKMVILATLGPTQWILYTRPEIKEISQLKGAILGVNRVGALDYYALRRLLQILDLSPNRDVKIVPAGAPLDRFLAIQNGLIHGALGTDVSLARNPIKVNRLVDLAKAGVQDHGSALITTASYPQSRPDVIDQLVRAFTVALALAKRNKELVKKVYSKYLRTNDEALLELAYRTYALETVPKIPVFPVEVLKNVLADLAEGNPKIKEVGIEAVLNNTFLQRLVDSGFIDRLYR